MSSVTVQTLLKTGRILPERSALQGDLKADPGALSPPGECSAHLPSDTSLRLRHRTHCHASLQRSARRRSVKRDEAHCPRTLTPLGYGRSCHKHKSLHDTTEWEAEGKDKTQTGVGAGPVLCSGTLRPDSVLRCVQSSLCTATSGCRYITLSTEPQARRTADLRPWHL